MALANEKPVHFLEIENGKFIEKFNEQLPNTQPRIIESTGQNEWTRKHDTCSGEIVAFELQESEVKKIKFLRFKMEDNEGVYFIKIFLNSNYSRSLIKTLLTFPRLNSRLFVLKPYDFTSVSETDGKKYRNTGVTVYINTLENRNKMSPLKNTEIPNLPEAIEKEGKYDFEPQSQFLFDRLKEKFSTLYVNEKDKQTEENGQPF